MFEYVFSSKIIPKSYLITEHEHEVAYVIFSKLKIMHKLSLRPDKILKALNKMGFY